MTPDSSAFEVRQKMKELEAESMMEAREKHLINGFAATDKFPVIKINGKQGFGIADAPLISLNQKNYRGKDIKGRTIIQKSEKKYSMGLPVQGMAVKIAIAGRVHPAGPGDEGKIMVKGIHVMPDVKLTDSWVDTGYSGWLDEDGFLFLSFMSAGLL